MALGVGITASGSGGDSATTGSFTSTSGSLLAVVGFVFNGGASFANGDVTDSKGNSYTLGIGSTVPAGDIAIGIWYNNAGTRGSSHTVTFNGPGTTQTAQVAVLEITGQHASSPYDATTDALATDNTSPWSVTAAAAISGNQIAIYGCTIDTSSNAAWTRPTGYSQIAEWPDGGSDLVAIASYKINETGTPAVAASSSHTATGSTGARELFATFKEGVASGPSQRRIWVFL